MSQSPGLAKDIRLPFDLYDFFGYLFPGAFLGFGCYVLLKLNNSTLLAPSQLLTRFNEFSGELSFGIGLFLLFILLVTLYLLGHVVGSLGSLILEKYLVKNIMGYPSDYYLGIRDSKTTTLSQVFYKWIFVCSLGVLTLGILAVNNQFWLPSFKVILLWVAVLFMVRIAILVVREWLILPKKERYGEEAPTYLRWVALRTKVTDILQFPTYLLIDLPARVLFASTGVLSSFDSEFTKLFFGKFKRDFSIEFDKAGTNGFWLCYVHVVKNIPSSVPVIRNFLHMYSFARNISAACFFLIVFQLFLTFMMETNYQESNRVYVFGLNSTFLLVGVLMLLRYFYIYSSYYTKYLFRAYMVSDQQVDLAE